MGSEIFSDIFNEPVFFNTVNFSSEDDIFNILDALGCAFDYNNQLHESLQSGLASKDREESEEKTILGLKKTPYSPLIQESETEVEASSSSSSNKFKRQKLEEGQQKISHITVERNRRKLMNEHLAVLRSLMPCFYVKRGDQASIIGGVINYINELQQILQSLKAKKQIMVTNESLSPKPSPPHSSQLSPCKQPPISPSTPQPSSPYKPPRLHKQQNNYLNSPSLTSPIVLSPCNSSTSSINDSVNELVATSKSAIAEVEVKFSGPNLLLLKTMSHRIPGQAGRIISALEELELEILDAKINTVDETMINFFTVKIGIECQLSAEELALQILQTFH